MYLVLHMSQPLSWHDHRCIACRDAKRPEGARLLGLRCPPLPVCGPLRARIRAARSPGGDPSRPRHSLTGWPAGRRPPTPGTSSWMVQWAAAGPAALSARLHWQASHWQALPVGRPPRSTRTDSESACRASWRLMSQEQPNKHLERWHAILYDRRPCAHVQTGSNSGRNVTAAC
jgi:hypothetical protein